MITTTLIERDDTYTPNKSFSNKEEKKNKKSKKKEEKKKSSPKFENNNYSEILLGPFL